MAGSYFYNSDSTCFMTETDAPDRKAAVSWLTADAPDKTAAAPAPAMTSDAPDQTDAAP